MTNNLKRAELRLSDIGRMHFTNWRTDLKKFLDSKVSNVECKIILDCPLSANGRKVIKQIIHGLSQRNSSIPLVALEFSLACNDCDLNDVIQTISDITLPHLSQLEFTKEPHVVEMSEIPKPLMARLPCMAPKYFSWKVGPISNNDIYELLKEAARIREPKWQIKEGSISDAAKEELIFNNQYGKLLDIFNKKVIMGPQYREVVDLECRFLDRKFTTNSPDKSAKFREYLTAIQQRPDYVAQHTLHMPKKRALPSDFLHFVAAMTTVTTAPQSPNVSTNTPTLYAYNQTVNASTNPVVQHTVNIQDDGRKKRRLNSQVLS